jgi:hypothetical protein
MTAYGTTDVVSIDNLPLLSGALFVTGSVAVTGISLSASFPSSMTVDQGAGDLTNPWFVSGSVTVANLPLPVSLASGSLSVTLSASISSGHTTQNITASLTSLIALFPNSTRLGASFFNTFSSKGNLYVSLGALASTGSFIAAVRPGGYYSLDTLTSEAISIVFDGAPGNVMVTEQT